MKNKTLMLVGVLFIAQMASAPSVMAGTSFPRKIADLEKYDNNRERSPLLSLKSITYGVIDVRNDVDYRQVRITQNGILKVFLKAYSGSIRVELIKNGSAVSAASALIGKSPVISTPVSAGEVIYIKVVGSKGSQYRLFVQ